MLVTPPTKFWDVMSSSNSAVEDNLTYVQLGHERVNILGCKTPRHSYIEVRHEPRDMGKDAMPFLGIQ